MNFDNLYIYGQKKSKKSTQNLACSQRQIHTVYTCKLSQAKNYQRTLIPIKRSERDRTGDHDDRIYTTYAMTYDKERTVPLYDVMYHDKDLKIVDHFIS